MNFEEALSYIHSLSKFGSKPGLDRVSRLALLVGNPQKKLKFIHFAGTSGKGSTASFTAAMLKAAGYRVGLYTSPFVLDFRERFQINGQMIEKEDFCRLLSSLMPTLERLSNEGVIITEFELNTVLGFLWFAEHKCDVVCLEVGMGGRFDATNIIDPPLCAVLCSIGLDHTEYLGDTVEKVAFEKCGIIKKGSATVSYPKQCPEAQQVIEDICRERGCSLSYPASQTLEVHSCDLFGSKFFYRGQAFELQMPGRHQIFNALTALCVLDRIEDAGFSVSKTARAAGLASVHCPARLEVLSRNPLVVIDGAHNADKISALAATVAPYRGRIIGICGMLRDKDFETAAATIAPLCRACVTVTPQNARALPAEEMAAALRRYCIASEPAPDFNAAAARALSLMGEGDLLLCFGSLYIAGQVRQALSEQL